METTIFLLIWIRMELMSIYLLALRLVEWEEVC